jgi:pyruvate dehydrogenase (quinone)
VLNAGQEGGDAGRRRRAARDRRGDRGGRALGAGVAKALLGKAAVPDDLPFVTGAIGLLGTQPSWNMMSGCDTLLMVGSQLPYSEFLPKEGQARGVQIDIDGRMLSMRYPMEVNLVGDSAETLRRCCRCSSARGPLAGARRSRRTSPTGGRCSRRAR